MHEKPMSVILREATEAYEKKSSLEKLRIMRKAKLVTKEEFERAKKHLEETAAAETNSAEPV